MKVKSQITPQIIAGAVTLLQPYIPELSPSSLVEALQTFGENSGRRHSKNVVIPPKGITPREAADILGCDVVTVRNYLRAGRLKGGKVGPRKWEVDPESVVALLPGALEGRNA